MKQKPLLTILENINKEGIQCLEKYFEVRVLLGLNRKEYIDATKSSEVIIIKSVTNVDKEFLKHQTNLKIIARAGTGLDNIDLIQAEKCNIKVLNVPDGNSVSAAEFTIMQILNLIRNQDQVSQFIQKNDFRRNLLEGRELNNLKVGVIGAGHVGANVIDRLSVFGCDIFLWETDSKKRKKFKHIPNVHISDSLEFLLSQVDVISLHASLNKSSFQLLNRESFKNVKRGAYLINSARADLINQDDLIHALDEGIIKAAAIDVISPEPSYDLSPEDNEYFNPLIKHKRVSYTPHIGASTIDAQKRISIDLSRQIIKEFFNK